MLKFSAYTNQNMLNLILFWHCLFISHLDAQRPTLGHWWRSSFPHLEINAFHLIFCVTGCLVTRLGLKARSSAQRVWSPETSSSMFMCQIIALLSPKNTLNDLKRPKQTINTLFSQMWHKNSKLFSYTEIWFQVSYIWW